MALRDLYGLEVALAVDLAARDRVRACLDAFALGVNRRAFLSFEIGILNGASGVLYSRVRFIVRRLIGL